MKKLIAVVLVIALLSSCLCACAPVGVTAGALSLLLSQCSAVKQETLYEKAEMYPEVYGDYDIFEDAEDVLEDVEDVFEDVEDIFDF